jgi:protein SCO1/2
MTTKRMLLKSAVTGTLFHPALASAAKVETKGPRADYFPNVILETHEGNKVRFYDDIVKGNKIVVFNMMYTVCTNICPPATANLMLVQQMLGDRVGRDVFFYSLTLRPEIDGWQALHAYALQYGMKPGWTLLTGRPADIEVIRRKLGFYDRDPTADTNPSQHTGMVRIGNEAFDRWSMMPALLTSKQLVNSILSFKVSGSRRIRG